MRVGVHNAEAVQDCEERTRHRGLDSQLVACVEVGEWPFVAATVVDANALSVAFGSDHLHGRHLHSVVHPHPDIRLAVHPAIVHPEPVERGVVGDVFDMLVGLILGHRAQPFSLTWLLGLRRGCGEAHRGHHYQQGQ